MQPLGPYSLSNMDPKPDRLYLPVRMGDASVMQVTENATLLLTLFIDIKTLNGEHISLSTKWSFIRL